MLSLLFGHFDLLAHPGLLIGIAAAICGICLIVFRGAFVTFLMDPKVLLFLAVVGGILGFVSLQHQNAALKAQVEQAAVIQRTTTDGAAAVTYKSTQQAANAVKAARITQALTTAPKGQATDAVMDEIAAQDGSTPAQAGSGSSNGSQPVGVRY